jgi:hypothetical protein
MSLNISKILKKNEQLLDIGNSYVPVFLNPKLENDQIKINQQVDDDAVVVADADADGAASSFSFFFLFFSCLFCMI